MNDEVLLMRELGLTKLFEGIETQIHSALKINCVTFEFNFAQAAKAVEAFFKALQSKWLQ